MGLISRVSSRTYRKKIQIKMLRRVVANSVRSATQAQNSSMQQGYDKKVLDHFEKPRNVGKLDAKKLNVGTGMVGAPACGDVMKLQIEVDDDGKIIDAKFKTFGCGSAIASSSLATEWLKGSDLNSAQKIRNKDLAEELCLPPVKIHCSVLAEDAIKSAIRDLKKKGHKAAEKTSE